MKRRVPTQHEPTSSLAHEISEALAPRGYFEPFTVFQDVLSTSINGDFYSGCDWSRSVEVEQVHAVEGGKDAAILRGHDHGVM